MLKHIRKYRPDWVLDVKVGRGKHTALTGLCHRVWHDQETLDENKYDSVLDEGFFENYNGYLDRPNSKVTNCLHDHFGLNWDSSLARYSVSVGPQAFGRAAKYLRECGTKSSGGKYGAVLIHYVGNTSTGKKSLAHWQAQALCELVIRCGRVPIILDWDNRSPLYDQKRIFNPGVGPDDIWGGFGSGDAEVIAALIAQSEAFIGIDSGPGKVASALDTPNLICWKGHHPIQFHDPSPSTLHLVPEDHKRLPPCGEHPEMVDFFKKHYNSITYAGEHGLVAEASKWLAQTLRVENVEEVTGVQFVLPNGIGDVMWALTKIQPIASGRPIDIILSGDPRKDIDQRAVSFLKRFPFVREAVVMDLPVLHDREHPTDSRGRYNYLSDGPQGRYHYLVPNRTLESGRRLEDWLGEYPCDYNVIDQFDWSGTERGLELGRSLSPFVAFYLGPESGHTDEGHNRGWLWEPKHWIELGAMFTDREVNIAVVGAYYDRSFWETYVARGVEQAGQHWIDLIGRLEIGETFALLRQAKCLISYQCGLGIVSHYLGTPTVMWWRPEGNSAHPEYMVSFNEAMKDAWVRPGWESKYLGCIYGRQSPVDIMHTIDDRGWLK